MRALTPIAAALLGLTLPLLAANRPFDVPRTWDDAEITRHEVPLANAAASPKHVTSDYYYKIPVRPIYKGYPVYAPGREPAGYMDWLRRQEPAVLWDDADQSPPLTTDADWLRAGELVFDAPTVYSTNVAVEDVTDPAWLTTTGTSVAGDGTMPWLQYVIRRKGVIELGNNSCAFCHSRVMADGSVIKGAQGNLPVQRAVAFRWRAQHAAATDKDSHLRQVRLLLNQLHASPFMRPDPQARIETMSLDEIASVFEAVPPGVAPRRRGNTFIAINVPDLIGVKDRRYLDRTGLEMQRSIGDMMRYAAMNQGGDSLANYAGFVPADGPRFTQLPPPERSRRYSDVQLYALARYVYSLQPPPNPHRPDAASARGERIFRREGCRTCHTPPLYTNNRLTPAVGFQVPPGHREKYDVMSRSVETDPTLTLQTRRGTGYYKVPSLRGVWYRGMFGHSGWAATLEDWFDPRRVEDGYVPTGWKPHDRTAYPVQGHEFGLDLSDDDRRALIAFLKTL